MKVMRGQTLELRKLHGAGNDFLVSVDLEDRLAISPQLARALCDRHRGLGADGVIRLLAPAGSGDLRMELINADGSPAETSGNGLRCLALAALDAGIASGPLLVVETTAGQREVEIRTAEDGEGDIAVDMGLVLLASADEPQPPEPALRARRADVGNPHFVLVVPALAGVSVESVGRPIDAATDGGANVEVIEAPASRDRLEMLVWERGAGVTLACGSGSCAAAAAARLWGHCGDSVTVVNPGGPLLVELSGSDQLRARAVLSGPTALVARIEVRLAAFDGAAGPLGRAVAAGAAL
jgi:diaminopimelate epimerase